MVVWIDPYRFASGGAGPGHPGVAAWVADNSSKVVAYYPGDDATTSGTMADDSGNGHNGTYSASGVSSGTIGTQAAIDLNGSAGSANVADGAFLDNVKSVFCVVEFDNTASSYESILSRDDNTDRNFQFRRTNTGKLQFIRIWSYNPTITGSTTLAASTPYTVGMITDGSAGRIYVDGVEDGALTAAIMETGAAGLDVGKFSYGAGGQYMNGRIASIVLLGSTATASDIAALHDAWTNGY